MSSRGRYSTLIFIFAVTAALSVFGSSSSSSLLSVAYAAPAQTLAKDVCVIGGGASGSYAAYQLKKRGFDVAVLERDERLGGNCRTWYSEEGPIDYGVQLLYPSQFVLDFLDELGVAHSPWVPAQAHFIMSVDTNEVLPTPPDDGSGAAAVAAALQRYTVAAYTELGALFELEQVPDFAAVDPAIRDSNLQPFGDFIAAHELEPLVPVFAGLLQGRGYVYDIPTFFASKGASPDLVQRLIQPDFAIPTDGCESIYDAIMASLSKCSDVFFGVHDMKLKRNGGRKPNRISFLSNGRDHRMELICHQTIISVRPTTDALGEFMNLRRDEKQLFGALSAPGYDTSVMNISHQVIQEDETSLATAMAFLSSQRGLGIPHYPSLAAAIRFHPHSPVNVLYVSESKLSEEEYSDIVREDLEALGFEVHEELVSESHDYAMTANVEAMATGFYGELQSIQGRDDIYYIGAVPAGDATHFVWRHAENLLQEHVY